jgi:quercetin dioxygenase-like cupin family protein
MPTTERTPTMPPSTEMLDIFVGPILQYLTPLTDQDAEYCLVKTLVPSGATVPIHSHADRETFFILSGELDGMTDGRWNTFRAGDVFEVAGGAKHAIRNVSGETMSLLLITTMRLGRFFRDVGRPAAATPLPAPTAADLQRFTEVAHSYGYWLGDAEDNAAVGIMLP